MATYHAIAKLGQAVLNLLRDARPVGFETAQFDLYQAANFRSPMEEGISLYLYRVAVNPSRRAVRTRIDPNGRVRRPGLPIDLYYLLTPWARSAEKQHILLGWAMRVLEDFPTLPAGALNHAGPEPGAFQTDETVDLINDPISWQDMTNIWEMSENNPQVSAAYVARMVVIDSTQEVHEHGPVQTRQFDVGKRLP
jgi:hypothetical protein